MMIVRSSRQFLVPPPAMIPATPKPASTSTEIIALTKVPVAIRRSGGSRSSGLRSTRAETRRWLVNLCAFSRSLRVAIPLLVGGPTGRHRRALQ